MKGVKQDKLEQRRTNCRAQRESEPFVNFQIRSLAPK